MSDRAWTIVGIVAYLAAVTFGSLAIYTGSAGNPYPPLFGFLAGACVVAPFVFICLVVIAKGLWDSWS